MSSKFGLTMRKKILPMRGMTPAMRARQASMRANYFIAKIAHMVTHNAQKNLVRIWSITYTPRSKKSKNSSAGVGVLLLSP